MSMTRGNFAGGLMVNGNLVVGNPQSTTGNVFFVQSTNANAKDDPAHGLRPDNPFATIDYAVGKCTASNGDFIWVRPGHVETVTAAAGLDLDVAGITLWGEGSGSLRPRVNFTTATTADMDVDAANITIFNFLFTGGIDALVAPLDINAADCKIIGCEWRDVTGQVVDAMLTDANCDRLFIDGWTHRGDTANAGTATSISIVGGNHITIRNFWIDGDFDTACIENVTTASTNLTIGGFNQTSYARTRNAADVIVTLHADATGFVGPHISMRLQDNAANVTEALVGAKCQFYTPLGIVNADGELKLDWNGTATVDI